MSLTSSPDWELAAGAPPRRRFGGRYEAVAVFAAIALAWYLASRALPPFLFPGFGAIGRALAEVLGSAGALASVALTYGRILGALSISFLLAMVLGIASGLRDRAERALLPLMQFLQGVPALCWVIFAVMWFKQTEARIAFVILISTLPGFYYQIREGVHAVPVDLFEMVRALRPGRVQLVRKLVLPALLPQILTAWRLEVGNGTKVTIIAELLGGISGIGYQLRLAQELFRMDRAIAWTAVLVLFVLGSHAVLAVLERRLLRWRVSGRSAR